MASSLVKGYLRHTFHLETGLSPPVKYFYRPLLCGSFYVFCFNAFASVQCYLVVT